MGTGPGSARPRRQRILGQTFHNARKTANSPLAQAGSTIPGMATLTGNSLKTVKTPRANTTRAAIGRWAIAKLAKHRAANGLGKRNLAEAKLLRPSD